MDKNSKFFGRALRYSFFFLCSGSTSKHIPVVFFGKVRTFCARGVSVKAIELGTADGNHINQIKNIFVTSNIEERHGDISNQARGIGNEYKATFIRTEDHQLDAFKVNYIQLQRPRIEIKYVF
ncbi:hypothetical protein GWI33_008766 [Rhynchophorus ferrugineus]|uniref:Uncharacterized protein n=1 Tax=Rhynchophorus ferrugineus TaxID=354439 RepID=A0A834IBY3_RHYFE|nr:hypothetical protein GWI33_008766 [Rhynchophorus ferrugineus]